GSTIAGGNMKIKPTTSPGRVMVELGRRDEKLMAAGFKDAETRAWPSPLKNILVPIDFSKSSQRALEYALPLAEKLGASLSLIHVIDPRIYPEDLMMGTEIDQVDARWMQSGRSMLDSLRREKIKPDVASLSL